MDNVIVRKVLKWKEVDDYFERNFPRGLSFSLLLHEVIKRITTCYPTTVIHLKDE